MSEIIHWWSDAGPSEGSYRYPLKVKVYKRGIINFREPCAVVYGIPSNPCDGWRPGKMWVVAGMPLPKGLPEEEYKWRARAFLDIVRIRLKAMG